MMKERPILFSAPMVRAILEGRKTVTRRLVNPQPAAGVRNSPFVHSGIEDGHGRELRSPYGQPGDRLWVRETWMPGYYHEADHEEGPRVSVIYRADMAEVTIAAPSCELAEQWDRDFSDDGDDAPPWHPSIHMPRWASRITLEVTGVRVERLQDISEADALAEGIQQCEGGAMDYLANDYAQGYSQVASFRSLWESIYGADSWAANPWVWMVEFKRMEATP